MMAKESTGVGTLEEGRKKARREEVPSRSDENCNNESTNNSSTNITNTSHIINTNTNANSSHISSNNITNNRISGNKQQNHDEDETTTVDNDAAYHDHDQNHDAASDHDVDHASYGVYDNDHVVDHGHGHGHGHGVDEHDSDNDHHDHETKAEANQNQEQPCINTSTLDDDKYSTIAKKPRQTSTSMPMPMPMPMPCSQLELDIELQSIGISNIRGESGAVFDIETALHRVVGTRMSSLVASTINKTTNQSGTGVIMAINNEKTPTYLSNDDANHYQQQQQQKQHEDLVENEQEWISNDTYVVFRVGHAGDAAKIASLYYRQHQQQLTSKKPTTTSAATSVSAGAAGAATVADLTTAGKDHHHPHSQEEALLELRLANGLGDEITPPSLFALLADTVRIIPIDENYKNVDGDKKDVDKDDNHQLSNSNGTTTTTTAKNTTKTTTATTTTTTTTTTTLSAVALFTMSWEPTASHQRIIRIEWFHVISDSIEAPADLIKRRLLLRLSTLALMTSCQLVLTAAATFGTAEAVKADIKRNTSDCS